nr:3937_t:CDS:2 [Entrophospora candida]
MSTENKLKSIIEELFSVANNHNTPGSSRYTTLIDILPETVIPYQGNKHNSLSILLACQQEISSTAGGCLGCGLMLGENREKYVNDLPELYSGLDKETISELTWKDPLANQVISDDSTFGDTVA